MKRFSMARGKPEAYAALLDELEAHGRARKDNRFAQEVKDLRALGPDDKRSQVIVDILLQVWEVDELVAVQQYVNKHPDTSYRAALAAVKKGR